MFAQTDIAENVSLMLVNVGGKLKTRAQMLMRGKVSTHVETVVLFVSEFTSIYIAEAVKSFSSKTDI